MMDQFLGMFDIKNLFNGFILFVIVGFLKILFNHYQKVPLFFKKYRLYTRKKELIKVKNNRLDDRHYLYELHKAQNWFITFLVVLVINFIWLINVNIMQHSTFLFLLLMLPSFLLEIVWLNQLLYVEDLKIYQNNSLEWKKRKQRKNKFRKRKKTK